MIDNEKLQYIKICALGNLEALEFFEYYRDTIISLHHNDKNGIESVRDMAKLELLYEFITISKNIIDKKGVENDRSTNGQPSL